MPNERNFLLEFIDSHIREVKWTLYGIGGVGCLLILKNVYATRKIVKLSDIPPRFLEKNVTLQGHVKDISCHGEDFPTLWTNHIPILSLFKESKHDINKECLPVAVAGINSSSSVQKWLDENLQDKHVWFKLLEVKEDKLHAVVRIRQGISKVNVNSMLVSKGIAKVHHYEQLPKSELYQKLITRLVALETKADRKGRGMWKEEKETYVKTWLKNMKSVLSFPSILWKRVWKKKS